jgi:tetratricopeptide (TPR) repeat protein
MRHVVIALCVIGGLAGAPRPLQADNWESRLRVAELYARAGDPDPAEKGLNELLKAPDVPPQIRARAEDLMRDVLTLRKAQKADTEAVARLRLKIARALIKDGDYAQSRQIASGVLEKASSLPLAVEAEKVYEQSQPGFWTKLWDKMRDISRWEWLLFAVPILAILAALIFFRCVLWFVADCILWARRLVMPLTNRMNVLVTAGAIVFAYCLALWFASGAVPVVPSASITVAILVGIFLWLPRPATTSAETGRISVWTRTFWTGLAAILSIVSWLVPLRSVAVNQDVPIVGAGLVVVLGAVLWLLCRPAVRPARLGRFDDTSNSGALALVVDAFARWSSSSRGDESTSGLLVNEASHVPSVPRLEVIAGDLLPDFSSLPALGGVNVGAVASAVQSIFKWFRQPYPILSGSVRVDESHARIQLSWQPAAGIITVASAIAAKADHDDPVRFAVEEASYEMLFLIQDGPTAGAVAKRVRSGLQLLNQYLRAFKHDSLTQVIEAFSSVRATLDSDRKEQLAEVHLYEGIARDLNEEHDLAVRHFQLAAELTATPTTKLKAEYNKAVAQLRSLYQLETLSACINTLQASNLIASANPPADATHAQKGPIYAFAYAVMADAIAHYPIYWRQTPTIIAPDAAYADVLAQNVERIGTWVDNVVQIASVLTGLNTSDPNVWSETARLQLKWLIANARGDVYLNAARYLRTPPDRPDLAIRREEYLKNAYEALRQCEVLLPPGVETLSNIGTVLLTQGKFARAREYLERAISLNPAYEYAYYRIAQSWEEERWREKLVATLQRFKQSPEIPEFRGMYQNYYVQPAPG